MGPFRFAALAAVAAAGLVPVVSQAQAAGDAAKGKALFPRCAICHDLKPGVNRLGPSLNGLFGRTAGAVPGFAYSPAMKASRIRWDAKSIDAYIEKPAAFVKGNKMAFVGLPNPADRANLIAYLAGATK